MVNLSRLKQTFLDLLYLSSPSRQEGLVASYIKERLNALNILYLEDNTGEKLGSTANNLIAWLEGEKNKPILMLNAHMDTVQRPEEKIEVIEKDDVLKSKGKTILGADDKSGIAIIIELLEILKENNFSHWPLQPVFTICEEIGLLGVKNMDYSLLKAKWGLVLDGGDPAEIIYGAPAANRFRIEVIGKEAHAGVEPEKGINAIWLTSKAISQLKWGRIDEETTCNIGLIKGGIATNIVPPRVILEGEVRSHKPEKLEAQTEKISTAFQNVIADVSPQSGLPQLNIDIKEDYPLMHVSEDHPLIKLLQKAGKQIGMEMHLKISGGGSDANIFNSINIPSVIIGTGMKNVHTCQEYISLYDMVKIVNILLQIITME